MCDPIDPVELAAKATGEAVEKVLESKLVNDLLAPVTRELGLTFAEVANIFRFYTTENLKCVFTRWARQRDEKPIKGDEFKRVLPLLQAASLESDEELQERWAALLESTVTNSENVLPSFSSTLSQLTAEEARYLEKLWTAVHEKSRTAPFWVKPNTFDFRFMLSVLDPEVSELAGEYRLKKSRKQQPSQEEFEAAVKFEKLRLIAQDLERLGIIGKERELLQGRSDWVEVESKEIEIPGGAIMNEWTTFTPYGRKFIKAVKPKIRSSSA